MRLVCLSLSLRVPRLTSARGADNRPAYDYTARSQALTPETLATVTAGRPRLSPRDVEAWLHLHWACQHLSGRRASADLVTFHTEHGDPLETLATQVTVRS